VAVADAAGARHTWHVLDNGAAPTLGTMLCVHGNPTWSYLWRRHLAGAPSGWRVVAVDQLGMGWSQRLEQPRRFAQRVDDLDDLTTELGVTGPVVLAAHDWGGPIGLGWALRHRDGLAGIVLANTGVALPGAQAPGLIRLARTRALRDLVCVRTPTFVRAAAALSRPPLPADVRSALAAPYGTAARRRAVGDFVADIPVEAEHPSRSAAAEVADRLGELRAVPVLLQWGPRDPVFSETYLRDLCRRLPQAAVHRYPRAAHLVTEDAPQTAADAWRWVTDLTDRPTGARSRVSAPDPEPLAAPLAARAGDDTLAVAELDGSRVRRTSFAQLEQRVGDLAAGLHAAGVRPGHRVALLVPPGLDLTAAVYACWRVGAVIVVADAGLGLRGIRDALRSADPDHIVGIARGLAAVAALRVPGRRIGAGAIPGPVRRLLSTPQTLDELAARGSATPGRDDRQPAADDEAAVLFTSGATGPAKGVVYRHGQLRAQAELVRTVCRLGPGDRLVAAFAPFALYGPALGIGAAVPDMDVTKPGTLTAAALAAAAAAIDATVVFASPAALRNVAATASGLSQPERHALARIHTVLSAGAPVPLSLLREVQQLLPNAELHTPYGMTEALPVADITRAEIEAAGPGNGVCVGRPLPGVTVRISALDPSGAATGELDDRPGVTGEICVAAAHVKDRYDRLWATERLSTQDLGWHRTGDVGHLDEAGRLWVEGRAVHVITTANGPLTPVGVEQRIETLPAVAAAALVGVGPPGTQQAVAVVVATQRAGRRVLAGPELARAVRDAATVPLAAVLVAPALPVDIRHASKVDRARLSRWAGRVLAGGRVGPP